MKPTNKMGPIQQWLVVLVCASCSLWCAVPCSADEASGNLNFFYPSPLASDMLTLHTGNVLLVPGRISVGAMLNFETPSLEVRHKGRPCAYRYIESRATVDALFSIGLTRSLEAGVAFPTVLHNLSEDKDALGFDPASWGLGDLRLHAKYLLGPVGEERATQSGFVYGLSGYVSVPTGDPASLFGSESLTVRPEFVAQRTLSFGTLFVNAGFLFRMPEHIGVVEVGQELVYGAGLWVPFFDGDSIGSVVELRGATQLSSEFLQAASSPAELDAALLMHLGQFRVTVGGGTGLVGYAVPFFRAIAGLTWLPQFTLHDEIPDRDGDGVPDQDDRCPDNPDIM